MLPDMPRRVRASFVLRCGIQLGIFLTVGIAVWIAGLPLQASVVLGLVALTALEIPAFLIEQMLVGRVARQVGAIDSVFFVDLDEESRRRVDHFIDDTRDNPTIR